MSRVAVIALAFGLAAARLAAADPPHDEPPLRLHAVPLSVSSYRLLSMTRDEDGSLWAGSIHRSIHRYEPATGAVATIPLPYDAVACSC
ncbi:MAG TPA: hypothetical protein VF170_12400, partial [Planctomycetaceae bacterium]